MRNPTGGQGLVEVALVLPILLILLGGTYLCCRAAFLHAAAESAAQAENIRAGRQLPGIERPMSETILPEGKGVVIRTESAAKSGILPAPFPRLAGRSKGIVDITEGEEIGFPHLPPVQASRSSEASVDCWGTSSASGRTLRLFVTGYVATGILR